MARYPLLENLLPHPRSLRLRALAVVLVVALLPLLVVAVAGWLRLGKGARISGRVQEVTARCAAVVADGDAAQWQGPLDDIARREKMRIRVLDGSDRVVVDIDHLDRGIEFIPEQVKIPPSEDPGEFDRSLGALHERPETLTALEPGNADGNAEGCRTTRGADELFCHGVQRLDGGGARLVYVQGNAPWSINILYESRYQLARLTLLVMPLALLLAFWLGWRLLQPIRELRQQLLDQAMQAAPGSRLEFERGDEFGDLATAFNTMAGRLEERTAANEAFMADLAHEFKNPVSAIRAAAESLEKGATDPRRMERIVRVLNDSSHRLDTLLDQFLALARAEAGLPSEQRAEVPLDGLVGGLVEAHAARFPDITFRPDIASPARVFGVAHELETVLRNLLDNAVAFAEGTVDVELRRHDGWVEITVSDDGPGIPREDRPRVFDRFFSTRHGKKGTGLGLALVRAVIEAHGGTVAVDSPEGAGAVFRLRLPAG